MVRFVFVYFSVCCALISIALFCYCLVQIRRYQRQPFFQKRRPAFVLITTIVLFVSILGDTILESLDNSEVFHSNKSIQIGFRVIKFIIWTFSYLISSNVLIRVWLLYYDMQLSHALKNKNWQMAINPNIVSTNWFLHTKNQSRYGKNGKYLIIVSIFIAIYQNGCLIFFAYIDLFWITAIQNGLVMIAQVASHINYIHSI